MTTTKNVTPKKLVVECDASLVWRLKGFCSTEASSDCYGVTIRPHAKGVIISATDRIVGGVFIDETGTYNTDSKAHKDEVSVELVKGADTLSKPIADPKQSWGDDARFKNSQFNQKGQPRLMVYEDGTIEVHTPSGKSSAQKDCIVDIKAPDVTRLLPDVLPAKSCTLEADPDCLGLFADCCLDGNRSVSIIQLDDKTAIVRTSMPTFVGVMAVKTFVGDPFPLKAFKSAEATKPEAKTVSKPAKKKAA